MNRFFPEEYYQKEDTNIKEEIPFSSISLDPSLMKRVYGVTLYYSNEKKILQTIQYKISLQFLKETENGNYLIEIVKDKIFVNEKRSSNTSDLLAETCGKQIYPLILEITRDFNYIGIQNHKEIMKRWKSQKSYLELSYKGTYAEQVIEKTEVVLFSYDLLESKLFNNDWFFNVFFNGITTDISHKYFPLIPYKKGIVYKTNTKIISHKKREKDIIFLQKGICIDQRNKDEILNGRLNPSSFSNQAEGNSEIAYHLYEDTFLIDAIIGEIQLEKPIEETKKVLFEIFNLKKEKPLTQAEIQEKEQKDLEKEIKEKKQKKRYFLFGKEVKI